MPERDLDLLIRAARRAADIAVPYWRNAPRAWDKPGHLGPVTEADLAVDKQLRDDLTGARPDYGWLSEESEDNPQRLRAQRTFVVDPIDGTRAFINGEKSFAHSLAIVENGAVSAGVVFLPLLDKLYTATRGDGARLNGDPLRVAPAKPLDRTEVLTTRAVLNADIWRGGKPLARPHSRPSLAYRLCLVAEGRFDAVLTLRDTWEWDIAAGTLILSEAGAAVSDSQGDALSFNTKSALARGLIAADAPLHSEIAARLIIADKSP